ncbi:MAG: LTA synthase family protein [Eggerthellaceae bacterium]|nr:LTA synthase family protein [Eggerthellaceae bacterium]
MTTASQHISLRSIRDFARQTQERLEPHRVAVRLGATFAAILLGFFLVEFAWNPQLFDMRPFHVAANLFFLAVAYAIIYYLGQRTRGALVAFLFLCLLLGTANYYLVKFKGQPVVPADLLAFPTAAEVGGGYSFAPDWHVVVCVVLFALACFAVTLLPKHPLNVGNTLVSTFAFLASISMFAGYLSISDIAEDFDCEPDSWSTQEYYADYGAALGFMKRVQDINPERPSGYSTTAAEEVLLGAHGKANEALLSGTASASETKPTVLVVMNETFADLSRLPGVSGDDAELAHFNEIAAQSIVSGTAYASSFAGGTCNSEFEMLLGASMAFMSEDTYPYLFNDLSNVESLASTLAAQGYSTAAVHPAEGRNWTRDKVYADMGFDAFYDIDHFEDAPTLRGFTTDRALYDFMLDLAQAESGPSFIFGITMQNHSGYTVADLFEEPDCDVRIRGTKYVEADEYATLLQHSDEDLAYLISRLEELDEPVILLFFGDHQAYLSEVPKQDLYGWDPYEATLEQMQQRQEVPYLIWANYETGAECSQTEATSLNYLGIQLLQTANLPLSSYQSAVADLRKTLPAVNAKGYLAQDGTWYGHEEGPDEAVRALKTYELIQFANLFDKHIARDAFIEG